MGRKITNILTGSLWCIAPACFPEKLGQGSLVGVGDGLPMGPPAESVCRFAALCPCAQERALQLIRILLTGPTYLLLLEDHTESDMRKGPDLKLGPRSAVGGWDLPWVTLRPLFGFFDVNGRSDGSWEERWLHQLVLHPRGDWQSASLNWNST